MTGPPGTATLSTIRGPAPPRGSPSGTSSRDHVEAMWHVGHKASQIYSPVWGSSLGDVDMQPSLPSRVFSFPKGGEVSLISQDIYLGQEMSTLPDLKLDQESIKSSSLQSI